MDGIAIIYLKCKIVWEKQIMIGFVILHYNAIDETINCIDSIKKNVNEYFICVVDNNSPNGTGNDLAQKYDNSKNIKVLLNNENLGFAKGNNVGFRYIKNNVNCDYICLINNDTLIVQQDFEKRIYDSFNEKSFAVLGPKIILKNGQVNRVLLYKPTLEKVKRQLLRTQMKYFSIKFGIVKIVKSIYNCEIKIRKQLHGKENLVYSNKQDEKMYDIILHGCFLVFSKCFFEKYDGLNENTFLYHEEELLYLDVMRERMHTKYDPDIIIRHMEDAATNTIVSSKKNKEIFKLKNEIKSLKVLRDALKEDRKYYE